MGVGVPTVWGHYVQKLIEIMFEKFSFDSPERREYVYGACLDSHFLIARHLLSACQDNASLETAHDF